MSTDDQPELWERQKGESEQAYYAFSLYRDQSTPRGYAAVISELGKSKTLIHRWGSRWFWRDRTRAWDRHLEEDVRREQMRATRAMARRQAMDAEAYQYVLAAPVTAALKKLNTPHGQELLAQLPLGDLIALSVLTARVFPRIAQAERLARGAPVQDLSQFFEEESGAIAEAPSPRETYDWMREALGALEDATGGRLQLLPPGASDA